MCLGEPKVEPAANAAKSSSHLESEIDETLGPRPSVLMSFLSGVQGQAVSPLLRNRARKSSSTLYFLVVSLFGAQILPKLYWTEDGYWIMYDEDGDGDGKGDRLGK